MVRSLWLIHLKTAVIMKRAFFLVAVLSVLPSAPSLATTEVERQSFSQPSLVVAQVGSVGTSTCEHVYRGQGRNTRPIQKATLESRSGGYTLRFTEIIQGKPIKTVWELDNGLVIEAARTGELLEGRWNLVPYNRQPPVTIRSTGAFSINMMVSSRSICTFTGTLQFLGNAQAQLFPGSDRQARAFPTPYSDVFGKPSYYRFRNDDFIRRNPGKQPPDYYLQFGEKYITRFMNETSPNLTPQGQKFLNLVAIALQKKIEDKLSSDPQGFAELEQGSSAFRKFAYRTHPDAYCESGWGRLPKSDRDKIVEAVDRRDLYFSIQGIITGVQLANRCGSFRDAIP